MAGKPATANDDETDQSTQRWMYHDEEASHGL